MRWPPAIRDIFTTSEVDFATELREKQEDLDQTNLRLKDAGASLADERRALEDLQCRSHEKHELEQKIANLSRSNSELRDQLSQSRGQGTSGMTANVAIGEADRGLDFDGQLAMIEQLFPNGAEDVDAANGHLSEEQRMLLTSLERADVLRGRVKAYQDHNDRSERQAQELKSRSHELEERYRKIVSICTGVEVDKVDGMLGNLVQAVVSEQKENMELGKVREFLRLVQGSE